MVMLCWTDAEWRTADLAETHIPIGLPLLAVIFEEAEPIAMELIGAIGLVAQSQGFVFKFLPALAEVFVGEVAKGDSHVGDEGTILGLAAVATADAEAGLAMAGEAGLQGEQRWFAEDVDVDDVLGEGAKSGEGDGEGCGFGASLGELAEGLFD